MSASPILAIACLVMAIYFFLGHSSHGVMRLLIAVFGPGPLPYLMVVQPGFSASSWLIGIQIAWTAIDVAFLVRFAIRDIRKLRSPETRSSVRTEVPWVELFVAVIAGVIYLSIVFP